MDVSGSGREGTAFRWALVVGAWVLFVGALVVLPHLRHSSGLAVVSLLGKVGVLVGVLVAGRAARIHTRRVPLGPVRPAHHALALLVAAAGLVAVGLWAFVLTR